MPRTITAYRVQVPSEFVSVVARCTSEREARKVARSRSEDSDGLHYVVGPNDGFREYTASFHNGTER